MEGFNPEKLNTNEDSNSVPEEHIKNKENSIEKKAPQTIEERIARDEQMGQKLLEKGYVTGFEVYQDPYKYFTTGPEVFKKMPPETEMYMSILSEIVQGPVLSDSVEDNAKGTVDKHWRDEIKAKVAGENDKELYAFYEANKFQSGTIKSALTFISDLDRVETLSPSVMLMYQEVRHMFAGKEGDLDQSQYKYKFNNYEKKEFIQKFNTMLESAINDVMERYK